MKLCFLIHSLSAGGAERTVAYLSNYTANHGTDTDIVIYGDRGFYEINDKVNLYTIGTSHETNNILKRIVNVILRISKFRKYIKDNKPDAVICLLYPSIFYTFFISNKIVKITSERSNPAYLHSCFKKLLRYILFTYADGIIFQTQRAMDYYSSKITRKGIVIPNAVGNDYVYKVPKNIVKENKISSMGSLKKEKDYFTLLNAFKLVSEKHPEFILEIYGDGPLKSELIQQSIDLNIQSRVFFQGSRPDAILAASNSKVFVMSSISEGMPNSLLEAMAVGLPCVSTDCPNGPAELIKHGENGLLVTVGDYEAMACAINYIIENEKDAVQYGMRAGNIRNTNSIDLICNQYLGYFRRFM